MHSDILIEIREKGMKHCMHKVNINTLETYISKEIFLKEQKVSFSLNITYNIHFQIFTHIDWISIFPKYANNPTNVFLIAAPSG